MPHIVTFQDYRGERTWKVSSFFLSHLSGVVMIENDFSRVKRNIDVPEIPQSEDAEIREYLESLGINYETSEYNRNRSRSPRSIQESQTDLRFAVQEGIDGAAKARNPEHALSPILAGLADFIAPGAADRFDSRGSLTICELPWEGREALLTARDPYQASKNSLTHKRTIKSQAIWPRVFACSQTQIQISERCSSR